ncbi:MAG: hypothetical protein FJX54_00490 [Alphaproteobacteria bacterium]|nr:hypothetical protein [Alphaproteobacteria bacterium]
MKFVLAAALVAAFALPASAQSFYIVQDAATKKCTVVSEKPTVTTTTVVGNTTYTTKTEAEGAMKTATVCTQ